MPVEKFMDEWEMEISSRDYDKSSADAHKKHCAQDETNNGEGTEGFDCDAVMK